jgi:hypothetical protein
MAELSTLEQVFRLAPEQFDAHWNQIDRLVQSEPFETQANLWIRIAEAIGESRSRGMPYFRMGILKLLSEENEAPGVKWLERAYTEDERFGNESGQLPHRMGAYRLLSLTKEYFEYLRKCADWQGQLLLRTNIRVLVKTLLIVYDRSLVETILVPSYSYRAFFSLITRPELSAFAIENYYCAERLIQTFFTQGQVINRAQDEYALARSIITLLGGVLEVILIERLPGLRSPTLGRLLSKAHREGIMLVGTQLSALSSLMLHLRNYLHPDLQRRDYLIDINTARGCKAALDWVIAELLQ